MKKKIMMVLALILSLCLADTVKAEDFYEVPNKGDVYFRSQHVYSYLSEEEEIIASDLSLNTLISYGSFPSSLTSGANFGKYYTVPWKTGVTEYYVVYGADLGNTTKEKMKYRRVALEDATYISEEAKAHITGILRLSWPYVDEEEAIANLVENGVLVEKTIDDNVYYTSPDNETPTKSVTINELVTASQMAIYYYTNPGVAKDVYKETKETKYVTVVHKNENPWELGDIPEVRNNIMSIYNYLLNQTGTNEEGFEIKESSFVKENDHYLVTIKTNRARRASDNIMITIKQGLKNINNSSFNKYTQVDDNTYTLVIDELTEENLEVDYTGYEYKALKTFAFEAVDGQTESQTVVSLSSENVPVSGSVEAVYQEEEVLSYNSDQEPAPVENPNTSANLPIIVVGACVTLFVIVILVNNKKVFLK